MARAMTKGPSGILVIDDLPEQRLTIEATLAELGEPLVCVSSGRDALKYLLEHDVAVILLDVNMPDMDGFETAELIRKRAKNAGTPIIFLTADHNAMQASRGYQLGAVDYLTSPFLPDVLRTKVGVFVALSKAQLKIREEADRQVALQKEQAARGAAEEQNRRMRVLGDAGVLLAGSLEGDPFEEALLELLVPTLADEAAMHFADASEGRTSAWVHHAGGTGLAGPAADMSPGLAKLSALASASAATAEGDPDREGRPRGIALPLRTFSRTLGALAVAREAPQLGFSLEERELLRLIAERASVAIDNRRLYRELQDRDRRKDEFLAMLSHELRNPLGAITAAAHVLTLIGPDDEKAARACQIIARQSDYLTRMIDDLLDVSRVTMGRITLTRVVLDLREVVDATLDSLRSAGRLDRHTVSVTGGHVNIEADSARMEQVITNLIVNAVKYSDAGTGISIEIESDDERALLRVTDDGIGISPELLGTMFDLFVQGGQSLDRGQGGLGIGLTLVKRLVELQGGTVRAKSDGTGKGSTFTIALPRVQERTPARTTKPREEERRASSLRVLLVDDNEDAREMMRAFFEHHDHEVHVASNGQEAIDLALEVRPDLALVDLGLPGIDGFGVVRHLRPDERTNRTLFVALTGYGQPEDRERSAEAGFEGHLVKPVSQERLDEVLLMAVRRIEVTEIAESVSAPTGKSRRDLSHSGS